ncbi:hypothetical protein CCACVL1_00827 [Corchorus capsularis]|uniref:Uncharacterized protein n=1 Tax=Corchorus capsularis TaxID=210143 RepID=A0A1R3KTR6_COCAP|nr:hypothetical protein CCACVL1_01329 [Corchorus capsularis]OMP07504.1 hypothetical protein CCACVL1_01291 [Corchorus capsularis]OMP10491.1 hypothetical protein CCACVL1_00939 [Corchorus capsularis]OMP10502.1 hypothetical protein CCACVL1_00924 [Corchorus capsularis]OMP10672.1 hypothetical protein CCACVL1_00827 [Corchorus capsularis]
MDLRVRRSLKVLEPLSLHYKQ